MATMPWEALSVNCLVQPSWEPCEVASSHPALLWAVGLWETKGFAPRPEVGMAGPKQGRRPSTESAPTAVAHTSTLSTGPCNTLLRPLGNTTKMGLGFSHSHFTDEKAEFQNTLRKSKVTLLAEGRAGISRAGASTLEAKLLPMPQVSLPSCPRHVPDPRHPLAQEASPQHLRCPLYPQSQAGAASLSRPLMAPAEGQSVQGSLLGTGHLRPSGFAKGSHPTPRRLGESGLLTPLLATLGSHMDET